MVARKSAIVHRQQEQAAATQEATPQQPRPTLRLPRGSKYDGPNSPHPPRQGSKSRWLVLLSTCGLTTLCVVVTYHVLHAFLRQPIQDHALSYKRTLSFEVCGGTANQKLSMLNGMVLAYELGRAAVLPNFIASGAQHLSGAPNVSMPMDQLYNVQQFMASMGALGVEIVDPRAVPPRDSSIQVDISGMQDPVEELASQFKSVDHLSVGCPLHKLRGYYFYGANARVMWAALDALVPSKQLARSSNSIVKHMKGLTHHRKYNFLHLRMEPDWAMFCNKWEKEGDGKLYNNCMNNTDTVDQVLANLNVMVTEPLYVAMDWQQADNRAAHVVAKLAAAGYQVLTAKDFLKEHGSSKEANAVVDYDVAMHADKFVGNGVSTYSALAIFQRRHLGRWASYYNGGNIPLAEHLPMSQLPWVFIYSSETPQTDYLVKAAVRSANRYKTLQPFCLWSGNASQPIYAWLKEQGVTMLQHQPTWADELWRIAEPHLAENVRVSPIFASREALIADFKRIDIPMLPELDQYMYVLFTEPDVFFHKKVSLSTFSSPLPELIGMAADPSLSMGVDGAVMLLNIPAAHESYEELKLFVLGSRHGGNFPGYGVGAQGAYMQFYEQQIKSSLLSAHFAAKPAHEYDVAAYIVRFHGPKPHEYLHFFKTLECAYGEECEHGLRRSLCPYVKKWHSLLDEMEDEEGLAMWYACLVMYAPHLKGLQKSGYRIPH